MPIDRTSAAEDVRTSSGQIGVVPLEPATRRERHLRKTRPILSAERLDQDKILRVLLVLTDDLLGGSDRIDRVPSALHEEPIRPSRSFTLRGESVENKDPIYAGISEESRDALKRAYERIWLTRMQAVCHPVPVAAYDAAERWFREETLTSSIRRPGVTFAPVLFLIAIHNWMWWRIRLEARLDGQPASRKGNYSLAALESNLVEDIDQFAVLLEECRCRPGDLVVMHVMGNQVGQWLARRPAARAGIARDKKPGTGATGPVRRVIKMLAGLDARWTRIRLANPATRILLAVAPKQPAEEVQDNLPWNWLDTLLNDSGAEPLRQHLCSRLGQTLSQPQTSRGHVLQILGLVEQVADLIPREFNVEDGWHTFLAEVLWTTLGNLQLENSPLLWERWAEAGDGRVPLARWCGRLAHRAEQVARSTPSHDLPGWAWIWYDLAKALLGRWLIGGGQAIACLGLWLEGYTETGKAPPPLTLGQRACGHSLDEIVTHWLGVSRAATSHLHRQYEDPEQQEAFVERLETLAQRLRQIPAIADHLADEATGPSQSGMAAPHLSDGEDDVTVILSQPKIYRYTARTHGEGG